MKCAETGKTQFSKREAHEFVNRVAHAGGDRLRAYHCPFCNTWHVTKHVERKELCPRQFLDCPLKHTQDFKKYLSND